jgi:hypothetical protein
MKEEKNIEKLFQVTFENFEVTPPSNVKKEIDKKINQKNRLFRRFFSFILILTIGSLFTIKYISIDNNRNFTQNKIKLNNQPTKLITRNLFTSNNFLKFDVKSKKNNISNKVIKKKKQFDQTNINIDLNNNQSINSKKLKTKKYIKKYHDFEIYSISKNKNEQKGHKRKLFLEKTDIKNQFNSNYPIAKEDNAKTVKLNYDNDNKNINSTVNELDNLSSSDTINITIDNQIKNLDSVEYNFKNLTVKNDPIIDRSHNYILSLSYGPTFGSRIGSNGLTITEKNSYQFNLGLSKSFNTTLPLALGLNLEYGKRNELYKQQIKLDSIYNTIDSIPIYDLIVPDSIIGYDIIQNSDTITSISNKYNGSSNSRFAFGFSIPITLYHSNQFGVNITPGFKYNFNSININDGYSSIKLASYQYQLMVELYYDWRRIRFIAGFECRFEKFRNNSNLYTKDLNYWMFAPNLSIGFKL